MNKRLFLFIPHPSSLILHPSSLRPYPFNRRFRQQFKLQRGGGVLAEEVVNVGREIDDGEAKTARGEQFAVARGGTASGGVGVKSGDDLESSERREPILL